MVWDKRPFPPDVEATVTAEQEKGSPWTFRKIHVQYRVRGRGLGEKAVQDAIRLSEEGYCSVAATLCGVVELTYDYVLVEDDQEVNR